MQWELISSLLDVYEKYVLGYEILEDGSAVLTSPSPAAVSELPRQVLRSIPGVDDALVWDLDRTLSAAKAKKKRRDIFRDTMKLVNKRYKPATNHSDGPLHTEQSGRFRSKRNNKKVQVADVSGVSALFSG